MKRSSALAALGALLFAALCGIRLGGPGLHYDECLLVPAAFSCLGRPSGLFSALDIGGVTWLGMCYVGAAKAWLFALLLRAGVDFSVESWRWFAVALVAVPLFIFLRALGRRGGSGAALLFAAWFMTDITVWLTTRIDYGPTALALGLRLLLLALWLASERLGPRSLFLMGLLAGFSIFDKLSCVVLLGPLLVATWGSGRRGWGAVLLGGALGCVPLLLVNAVSWGRTGELVSLRAMSDPAPWRPGTIAFEYLSLGQGSWVRGWFMDLAAPMPLRVLEAVAAAGVGLWLLRARDPLPRRLAASWWLVLLGLLLLPRRTEAHHWILGTPFLYAAAALALPVRCAAQIAALVLTLLLRGPMVSDTLQAVRANRTNARFDPSLTVAAQHLARATNALVIATTWGEATQILGLAQGRPGAVNEAFPDPGDLRQLLHDTAADTLYLVEVPRVRHLYPAATARAEEMAAAAPGWRAGELEPPLRNLAQVRVQKFAR